MRYGVAVFCVICMYACRALAGGGDGLLIVAPRALADSVKEFAEFKTARRATQVLVLEEVLGREPGADDPEKLKRAIYDSWKDWGVGYVLLVGDADVMPVRYMVLDRATDAAFDYAFYPSDLYYADVAKPDGTFEDWNGVHDKFHAAYFGEVRGEKNKNDPINYDRIDYRAEVGVGRWPVSTAEDVKKVAACAMAYETAVEKGEVARTAALVHVGGWVDVRGRMNVWDSMLPQGWKVEKRFFKDGNKAFDTAPPNAKEVLALINAGTSLVVHAGHGSDDVWEGCLGSDMIGKFTNAGRVIMMSAGCSTARCATLPPYEAYEDTSGAAHKGTNGGEVFKAPPPAPACYAKGAYNMTGLGERLVRECGAVVYIGCNTGSQPCGVTLAEGFVEGIGVGESGGRHALVGDCWRHAIAYYWDHEGLATIKPTPDWYPASIFFQGMKFMVYGDPSLPVAR